MINHNNHMIQNIPKNTTYPDNNILYEQKKNISHATTIKKCVFYFSYLCCVIWRSRVYVFWYFLNLSEE